MSKLTENDEIDDMSAVRISTTCLATTADGGFSKRCLDVDHTLVAAVVWDCPFARRDANGTIRYQWRRKANQECQATNHHPLLAQHVSVPIDALFAAREVSDA